MGFIEAFKVCIGKYATLEDVPVVLSFGIGH